jgi:hypothetical protein
MGIKINILKDLYPESILLIGFDKAILGVSTENNIVYDINKIRNILLKEGMPEYDVDEYIDFNILGAYYGEFSPIYINKL